MLFWLNIAIIGFQKNTKVIVLVEGHFCWWFRYPAPRVVIEPDFGSSLCSTKKTPRWEKKHRIPSGPMVILGVYVITCMRSSEDPCMVYLPTFTIKHIKQQTKCRWIIYYYMTSSILYGIDIILSLCLCFWFIVLSSFFRDVESIEL